MALEILVHNKCFRCEEVRCLRPVVRHVGVISIWDFRCAGALLEGAGKNVSCGVVEMWRRKKSWLQ